MKTPATRAERRYLNRISNMPCALCVELEFEQSTHTEVHHVREGQGASQRAGHYCVVPLCTDCHRGRQGVHGDQTLLRVAKISEMDLLNMTIAKIAAEAA